MARAAPRSVIAAATVALVLLTLPIAAAQSGEIQTCHEREGGCPGPVEAFIQGLGGVVESLFTLVMKPVIAVANGIGGLILGFLSVPIGLFSGLGAGFGEVGRGAFAGVQGFFAASFATATSFFSDIKIGGVAVLGPFAPLAATGTVVAMVLAFAWLVGIIFRRSDDLLPEWAEKMFQDEDDE